MEVGNMFCTPTERANTARSSCRHEASTTPAEIAALIDSTEVSLYQPEMIGREVRGG
jgi:hypothetical protein